jgi:hypothetical protein
MTGTEPWRRDILFGEPRIEAEGDTVRVLAVWRTKPARAGAARWRRFDRATGARVDDPSLDLPFSLENLRRLVPRPLDHCARCQRLPAHASTLTKHGETTGEIPTGYRLVPFFSWGATWPRMCVDRCEECNALYYQDSEYEFLIGGSEDSQQIRRMTVDEFLEMPELTWPKEGWRLCRTADCWALYED